ncbi:MAG: LysR family transcriptional regulator [Pseudomonadota bacterium]
MLNSRLTVKHLEMIHAIDSAETLTRAAELLNISQPALSSRLHDAEEILGTALFQRRGRRLTLAPAGQLLLRSARSILTDLANVESELRNLPDQTEQRLRIAMPQYASFSWLPTAVKVFEERFPSVELQILSETPVQPRQALTRGDVDMALVSSPERTLPVDANRFSSRLLIRDEFVALLPRGHRKADKAFLVADDFVDETYITNSAMPERNREYELFFQPNAVYPERVVQVGFTGAILKLVAAGIGSTIITRWILETDSQFSDVVSKPLTRHGLFINWFAVYPRESPMNPQLRELCAVVAGSGGR